MTDFSDFRVPFVIDADNNTHGNVVNRNDILKKTMINKLLFVFVRFCSAVDAPADDDAVVKQVDLDVLDADGLVEALRNQQAQEPPQVRRVVQGDAHLRGEAA